MKDIKGLNSFATDLKAEEEGIWTPVGDMEFRIAKAGNKQWRALQKRLEATEYGNYNKARTKRDDEKDAQILLRCLAETSVLDWKNVTLDGKDIPYSVEKSISILTDKRFKKLAGILLEIALDEEAYAEEVTAEDIKKPKTT